MEKTETTLSLNTGILYTSPIIIKVSKEQKIIKVLKTRYTLEETIDYLSEFFNGYIIQYEKISICF